MNSRYSKTADFNEGHIVEGLDRCHIIMSMIEDHLVEHPAVLKANVNTKILKAQALIMDAYQYIGALDD